MQAEEVGIADYLLQRSTNGSNIFLAAVRAGREIPFLETLDGMFTSHPLKHPFPGWHRRNQIGDAHSSLHWAAIYGYPKIIKWLLKVDPGLQTCVNAWNERALAKAQQNRPHQGTMKLTLAE